jgi:hypothetical protein
MNQEETFNIIFKKLQNPFKFSYKMLKFEYLKECVTNLECVFLFSKLYALKKNLWKKIWSCQIVKYLKYPNEDWNFPWRKPNYNIYHM